MSRKSTRTPRLTRREKMQQERMSPPLKPDVVPTTQAIPKLEPKNANQKAALSLLNRDTPVVLLTGSAGTGKSLLAAYRAANLLRSKKIEKLVLLRPAVPTGKTIGLLPGTEKEKMSPYFKQFFKHLERYLGKGDLAYKLEKNIIEMQPFEYIRGMSFEDCMVVMEEGQNLTPEDYETFLTRLGDNCQIVVTGDVKQNDLKGASGLGITVKMLQRALSEEPDYLDDDDLDALDAGFGVVEFKPEDVVRSGLTRAIVKIYYYATT